MPPKAQTRAVSRARPPRKPKPSAPIAKAARKSAAVAKPAAARPAASSGSRTTAKPRVTARAASTQRARAALEIDAPPAAGSLGAELRDTLAWLERHGTQKTRDGMVGYGIIAPRAFGVTVKDLRTLGKRIGRHHELARALWSTGWYEARMLSAFVADPEQLTSAEMDSWCRDFDNWAVCDTLCFHLFDRSSHAFAKVSAWAQRPEEFVQRAAFALLASLALHDRSTHDERFAECLPLIERGARDSRNFVKKGVSWALRAIGGRSSALHEQSLVLAQRLVAADDATARWVGKDAQKDLEKPGTRQRLATREARISKARTAKARTGKRKPSAAAARSTRAV
jgi:3-methyladenine DNA glycosylase AlkD